MTNYLEIARRVIAERNAAKAAATGTPQPAPATFPIKKESEPEIAAPLPMPERVGPDTFRLSDGSVWRETITPTGWILERLRPAERGPESTAL
jgi:hypothetical protein